MSKKKLLKLIAKCDAGQGVKLSDDGHVLEVGVGYVKAQFAGGRRYKEAAAWMKSQMVYFMSPVEASRSEASATTLADLLARRNTILGEMVFQPFAPSAGVDPEPADAPTNADVEPKVAFDPLSVTTLRQRVLDRWSIEQDRVIAGAALKLAADELRKVPSQSFWNAADELEGIVRDKAAPADPHAEVPA